MYIYMYIYIWTVFWLICTPLPYTNGKWRLIHDRGIQYEKLCYFQRWLTSRVAAYGKNKNFKFKGEQNRVLHAVIFHLKISSTESLRDRWKQSGSELRSFSQCSDLYLRVMWLDSTNQEVYHVELVQFVERPLYRVNLAYRKALLWIKK